MARFAAHLRAAHAPGQRVAVVAHNALAGMLLATLAGLSYRHSLPVVSCHAGITLANVAPDTPMAYLRVFGCARHLTPSLISF